MPRILREEAFDQFETERHCLPHQFRIVIARKSRAAPGQGVAQSFPRIPPVSYWAILTYTYGRSNQTAQARHALQELLNPRHPVDPQVIAQAYAGLGDKDQSVAWLEKAYAAHSNELVSLKVSPEYDSLRSDPRFQDLLRRVALDN